VVRIWIVFLLCVGIGVLVSLLTGKPAVNRPVELSGIRFATEPVFNLAGLVIIAILVAIYVRFW